MRKLSYLQLSVLFLVLFPGIVPALTPIPPEPTAAPEPMSFLLVIAGVLGILGFRRIFNK
jgi:hypothetical protein